MFFVLFSKKNYDVQLKSFFFFKCIKGIFFMREFKVRFFFEFIYRIWGSRILANFSFLSNLFSFLLQKIIQICDIFLNIYLIFSLVISYVFIFILL